MVKGETDLSHEEIWDDSALIDSWNSALDEYKRYHSIHAKGGSLQDLEKVVEESAARRENAPEGQFEDPNKSSDRLSETGAIDEPRPQNAIGQQQTSPGPSPPEVLLGSVEDESLKKLMMAWYYAGYYTGLFEGQQQAQKKP